MCLICNSDVFIMLIFFSVKPSGFSLVSVICRCMFLFPLQLENRVAQDSPEKWWSQSLRCLTVCPLQAREVRKQTVTQSISSGLRAGEPRIVWYKPGVQSVTRNSFIFLNNLFLYYIPIPVPTSSLFFSFPPLASPPSPHPTSTL